MFPSHESIPKPSPLLALVAFAVVHRLRPAWCAVDLGHAARQEAISPERLSRLCTRALAGFEQVLAALTRIGRPRVDRPADTQATEIALLQGLLEVARQILAHVPLRRGPVRALLVGAWLRLHAMHPSLTQQRFCDAVSLSTRTLRAWLVRPQPVASPGPAPSPVAPPPTPRPPRKRGPRCPRFGFQVVLPGTQIGADTTDLSAFGVPLKLMAAQDIGGRDQSLFEAVSIEDHESAEHIAQVLTEALQDKPGAQAITDQGTPYMAQRTREALEALQVEHAPQKEGEPTAKATVERAFETLKGLAAPLLSLTDRVARAVPSLCRPDLARATATLVMSVLLRAYQHGARAARAALQARGSTDPDTLRRMAEASREQARATDDSARLLLTHIHELYGITRPLKPFVDGLRRYPLPVLREAEHQFAQQVYRDDIRDRASYFAAIVRREYARFRRDRIADQRAAEDRQRRGRDGARADAQHQAWHDDPVHALQVALETLAGAWDSPLRVLVLRGSGPGSAWLGTAIAHLIEQHGQAAALSIALGVLNAFRLSHCDRLKTDGMAAIEAIFQQRWRSQTNADSKIPLAQDSAPGILPLSGRSQRPPPPIPLRT